MKTSTVPLMKNAFFKEKETKKALAEFIISADKLSMGEKCLEFEKKFARWQGTQSAILFNSGGSANLAMLQALKNLGKLKNGDKVGFSALTWATNVMPIIQLGFSPVPVDCDPMTLNVMSGHLEKTIKKFPIKAFFITNALGFAGDLYKIRRICRKNKIILLEDNCEALGTKLKTGRTGNFGLASTFSFFVAHHMSTIEGGAVCTNDDRLANMLRIVRANGWDRNLHPSEQIKWRKKHKVKTEFMSKYTFYDLGFNFRPTEITGFIGLYQLDFLNENISAREKNYMQVKKYIQKNADLICLKHDHIRTLSPFCLPILCRTTALRNRYYQKFTDAGIETRPMIAGNIQKQPFYKKYVADNVLLPGADFVHHNSFYCGFDPELTEQELNIIISCLKQR